ncbi:MAG: DUF402 domain-containing protein [Erysipelotrichaceae bacterium]|nr:DUF402 domain-containing protein [Erysipelotrichaceae bacterium]
MGPRIGTLIYIQSYKHDGSLHRTWSQGFVIEANDKRTVVVTNKTWVTEADGRKWYTREPAICFFYPDRWFNVICMMRKTGVYYYCNLASPSIYDGEALKHIDYDLDVKVFPDGQILLLDEDEYEEHQKEMNYPDTILTIIEDELQILLDWIEEKRTPFCAEEMEEMFQVYLKLLEANNKREYYRVIE